MTSLTLVTWLTLMSHVTTRSADSLYSIGVGIGDITASAAGVVMMGYASPSMITEGIHTRLYARAFIVCHRLPAHRKCVVFVNLDCGMTADIGKIKVSERLTREFGGLYGLENVLLSATHTHSGPGGYLQYALFQLPNIGWLQETYEAQVEGIVTSIRRAHASMSDGMISWSRGRLDGASINRSPTAYLMNPEQERRRYDSNTDNEMFLLKFMEKNGKPKGVLNWFAVHGTSMNSTNKLISGDNKGYAQQVFETRMNKGAMPGKGAFVAAFASTNLGDVSPNTRGAVCVDTGLPCDMEKSTCEGRVQLCRASGPGNDMTESTAIIGHQQYEKAMELFMENSQNMLTGPVDYIHQYIDMSNQTVWINSTKKVKTCAPAMGFSFAAGTTDGPGALDFTQSDTLGSSLWNFLRDLIKKPSESLQKCHHPKPILLATGEMERPYSWQPTVVAVQMLRIGDVVIAAVPGEFTTMAGRRLRDAIRESFKKRGLDIQVTIAGLANTYSDYVTTYQEYQKQRYEGASTLFGPHTHMAYVQKFRQLSDAMISNTKIYDEKRPPNQLPQQITLLPQILFDSAPLFQNFGDVLLQPPTVTYPGQKVEAIFISGHPRNDPMLESSFLQVQRLQDDGSSWTTVATDASWQTIFTWRRTNILLGHSEATVTWYVPHNVRTGIYKIKHMGYHKSILSSLSRYSRLLRIMRSDTHLSTTSIQYYEGETNNFQVIDRYVQHWMAWS